MPAPTITTLPTPPSRSTSPSTFATQADAFVAALPEFVSDANAQASYLDGIATAADADATAAAASAAAALVSQNAAASSASAASASATTASNAATAAAASYDSFDDRYLGPKASDPSVDNDGNALLTGALYWNTASNVMKAYTGAAWVIAYNPATGFLTTDDIGVTVQGYDTDLTAWASKTAPSGTAVGTTDTQTLTNKTLQTPNITSGLLLSSSAGTSGQVLASQGSGVAPAWVNAAGGVEVWAYVTMNAGAPTLQNSKNVSSITDLGVGQFDVNTTTRNSQYYASVASCWGAATEATTRPSFNGATTKIALYFNSSSGTLTDPTFSWSVISAGAI